MGQTGHLSELKLIFRKIQSGHFDRSNFYSNFKVKFFLQTWCKFKRFTLYISTFSFYCWKCFKWLDSSCYDNYYTKIKSSKYGGPVCPARACVNVRTCTAEPSNDESRCALMTGKYKQAYKPFDVHICKQHVFNLMLILLMLFEHLAQLFC